MRSPGGFPRAAHWWPRCSRITATPRRRGASGTTRRPSRPARPARSSTGRRISGFEYFYGFLAGESSQFEPNLVRNTTFVLPPKTPEEGYHLNEDLADDAISWLHKHKAMAPDRPFFMYWASGAIHGPHHAPKEYIDKYRGKFDDGWDAYRERVFERAKEKGWIPPETQLTPRHEQMASWESIPESERPFQSRLMEVCAGLRRTRRCPGGAHRRRDRSARLRRQHADLLPLGRQRHLGAGPGRHHQRAGGPQRHRHHHRTAARGARGTGRPGCPRRTQERPDLPLRMGLGRQHPLQGHHDPGRVLRRHPQPDGHPVAGEDHSPIPPRVRSSITATTSSRRSTRSSASPRLAW